VVIDRFNLFNNYAFVFEKYSQFEQQGSFPDDIFAIAYHRRFVKRTYYFFSPYQPQLIGIPIILLLPRKPSGRRVYSEIWAVA